MFEFMNTEVGRAISFLSVIGVLALWIVYLKKKTNSNATKRIKGEE